MENGTTYCGLAAAGLSYKSQSFSFFDLKGYVINSLQRLRGEESGTYVKIITSFSSLI